MNQPAEQKMPVQALFISDLHLQPALPKTTRAFLDFLKNQVKQTEQLYILGDLFEYWAGDDDMDSDYLETIVRSIREAADSGTAIFWICGNRDFLTGERFLEATGARALPELSVIESGKTKIALAHGDAQCTDDQAYMQFRNMVRNRSGRNSFWPCRWRNEKPLLPVCARTAGKAIRKNPPGSWMSMLLLSQTCSNRPAHPY